MSKKLKLQQGDVILKTISNIPSNTKLLDSLVLAEGEATGHRHQIISGVATLVMLKNKMFLKVISDYAVLRHGNFQEPKLKGDNDYHNDIEIPKGDYEVRIVRETDPFEEKIRRVQD